MEGALVSEQKHKVVVAATLAVISVFLLGGVSFSFFPSQIVPAADSVVEALSAIEISSSSKVPLSEGSAMSIGEVHVLDGICIAEDGSVNSTATPILQVKNVYTLTDNIVNRTLIVQKDDIIIDGGGYTLEGYIDEYSYADKGINLQGRSNVTVKNLQICQFGTGIWIQNSSNLIFKDNVISDCKTGIGTNPTIRNPVISYENGYGIGESSSSIDAPNLPVDVSKVGKLNSVKNNILVNVEEGINVGENATIRGNTLIEGVRGIGITSYCSVSDNVIANFSDFGVSINGVNSVIYENQIVNCSYSIHMGVKEYYPGVNNTIYHNNFVNNTSELLLLDDLMQTANSWSMGKEGNYWSNYTGIDADGDGVGDTSYIINGNAVDKYPLMQPYQEQISHIDHAAGNSFLTAAILMAIVLLTIVTLNYWINRKRRKTGSSTE